MMKLSQAYSENRIFCIYKQNINNAGGSTQYTKQRFLDNLPLGNVDFKRIGNPTNNYFIKSCVENETLRRL